MMIMNTCITYVSKIENLKNWLYVESNFYGLLFRVCEIDGILKIVKIKKSLVVDHSRQGMVCAISKNSVFEIADSYYMFETDGEKCSFYKDRHIVAFDNNGRQEKVFVKNNENVCGCMIRNKMDLANINCFVKVESLRNWYYVDYGYYSFMARITFGSKFIKIHKVKKLFNVDFSQNGEVFKISKDSCVDFEDALNRAWSRNSWMKKRHLIVCKKANSGKTAYFVEQSEKSCGKAIRMEN